MPRTIHVTVSYSVHIEDDTISDEQALTIAKNNDLAKASIFDLSAEVFERWKNPIAKRGIGSY